MSSYLLLKCKC